MKIQTTLLAVAALGFASAARAVVIDFNGEPSDTIYNAPIVRSGFTIGLPPDTFQHFHIMSHYTISGNPPGFLLNDSNYDLIVASGGTFTLTDVDLALDPGRTGPASALTVSGFLNNVLTGTISVQAVPTSFTRVNGSTLGTVDRLVFSNPTRQGFALDNLQLNGAATPAPDAGSTASLTGLALIAIAALRRRLA